MGTVPPELLIIRIQPVYNEHIRMLEDKGASGERYLRNRRNEMDDLDVRNEKILRLRLRVLCAEQERLTGAPTITTSEARQQLVNRAFSNSCAQQHRDSEA